MFDFVRQHTKIMQIMLFVLILPSFVFFGIDGYQKFNEKGEESAKVDGKVVSAVEWDNFHKREAARLRETMPSFDPKLMDSPEAKFATLERLVRERVLTAAAGKLNLVASDGRLARDLSENEAIASLRSPDGKVDMARYAQLVAQQGFTPAGFEDSVRRDLAARQVMLGVTGASFTPPAVVATAVSAFYERREAQVIKFAPGEYGARVQASDADVEQYFAANRVKYQAPERAEVEYVQLDLEAVKKSIVIPEVDLQKYFEDNRQRLAAKEERRASHILINSPKDGKAAEKAAARAKAADLLVQVRKTPANFAELARANSQDPGSAENGGDLDFFARGAMVKPFDDAAFSMKKGDISEVVESDFGFHIIQLVDIKAPKERTFAEARPDLEAELKKQQAQKKYAELAESFTNLIFEQPDSLKAVAERLKLDVRTGSSVSRTARPGVGGAFGNQRFLTALFSADTIDNKRNTPAIEVGANQIVSGRMAKYTPARPMELVEVRDNVRAQLIQDRATAMARAEGEKTLAALAAKTGPELPGAIGIARDLVGEARQPQKLVDAVLRVDPAKLPLTIGIDLGAQGYAVARVNKILTRDVPKPEQVESDRKQYAQSWNQAESDAYYNTLKKRFNVELKVVKPAAKSAEPNMQVSTSQ